MIRKFVAVVICCILKRNRFAVTSIVNNLTNVVVVFFRQFTYPLGKCRISQNFFSSKKIWIFRDILSTALEVSSSSFWWILCVKLVRYRMPILLLDIFLCFDVKEILKFEKVWVLIEYLFLWAESSVFWKIRINSVSLKLPIVFFRHKERFLLRLNIIILPIIRIFLMLKIFWNFRHVFCWGIVIEIKWQKTTLFLTCTFLKLWRSHSVV